MRIFVYGTLMTGCGNHYMIAGSDPVSMAELPGFIMHDIGAFPGIVESGRSSDVVRGEVYEVSDENVFDLDRFEGCPRLYRRQLVKLTDGTLAETYVFAQSTRGRPVITSGDWRNRAA